MMGSRKNILLFADRLPPLIGGMEMHAQSFIEYFKNHSVFYLVGVVSKNNRGKDILVLEDESLEVDTKSLNKIIIPDIIFFNSGRWIEELTKIRRVFPHAKIFYRTGGNEILKAPLVKKNLPSHKGRQSYWVEEINKNVDLLITNSLYTEKRLEALGINRPFERFIGGVNMAHFKKERPQRNQLASIFCAARFVPYKNHSFLMLVIKELQEQGLQFEVRLAGEGPLLSQIKKEAHQLKLNDTVEFLGPLDNMSVCREMVQADIYMQLSKDSVTKVKNGTYVHSEGMGRSILEALSAGTFVIAANSGALPEIVVPSRGILLNLDDQRPRAIAQKIAPFIKTPPQKNKIQDTFDWQKIFEGYEKLFEKI